MVELSFKKIFIPLDVEKDAVVKAGDRILLYGKKDYIERQEGEIPREFREKAIHFFTDLENLVRESEGKVIEGEIYSDGETKTVITEYNLWIKK